MASGSLLTYSVVPTCLGIYRGSTRGREEGPIILSRGLVNACMCFFQSCSSELDEVKPWQHRDAFMTACLPRGRGPRGQVSLGRERTPEVQDLGLRAISAASVGSIWQPPFYCAFSLCLRACGARVFDCRCLSIVNRSQTAVSSPSKYALAL